MKNKASNNEWQKTSSFRTRNDKITVRVREVKWETGILSQALANERGIFTPCASGITQPHPPDPQMKDKYTLGLYWLSFWAKARRAQKQRRNSIHTEAEFRSHRKLVARQRSKSACICRFIHMIANSGSYQQWQFDSAWHRLQLFPTIIISEKNHKELRGQLSGFTVPVRIKKMTIYIRGRKFPIATMASMALCCVDCESNVLLKYVT